MLVLLVGGARSGKSRLALELAARSGREVVFVATGEPSDDEMAARIALHRDERPAAWRTVEEPRALRQAIADVPDDATLVVDCLSLWVANVLEATSEGEIVAEAAEAAGIAADRNGLTVIVTNEVGFGLVPMHPVGRAYRDTLGRVNAAWSEAADEAYLVVAGRRLALDRFDAG
jgi:adenosyl cobinamide kinase/adenosyl cobinamide phosphate guanylyltransferase